MLSLILSTYIGECLWGWYGDANVGILVMRACTGHHVSMSAMALVNGILAQWHWSTSLAIMGKGMGFT